VRERVRECVCVRGKYVCMCIEYAQEDCWMYVTVSESVCVRERLCENMRERRVCG